MKRLPSVFVVALLNVAACGTKASPATDESAEKASANTAASSSSAQPSATTPPAPTVHPAVAAVRAGKVVNPATKKDVPLVETSLAKCFGFKGYSMMVPEGSTLETVSGARACGVFSPSRRRNLASSS